MSLQDYTLHEVLGAGTAATVVRAVHRPTDTPVAMKQVHTDDPRMVRAVEQEIRAMARVNHPNLLAIYDHGRLVERGGIWLALEYASAGSLDDWQPQRWDEVWGVLDDVLHGLAHAHARGLVHRDLKPGNLLRARPTDASPGVKIGDFGLTTLRGEDPAVPFGGTPLYMAPEQWRREPPAAAADLYALGCILWQWVTGTPPFQGSPRDLRHHHTATPPRPLPPRFDVPGALPALLASLLAKDPAERPSTAGEVRRRLDGTSPSRAVRQMLLPRPTLPSVPPGMGLALLPLRDHTVVGRQLAKQALVASLEQALKEKRAHVHLVSGAAGMGTTRMARWIGETAADAGVARLLVSPTVAEAQEAAEQGPVVALYDDLSPETETRLEALRHTRGSLLAVACTPPTELWPELAGLDAVHRLELGPMDDSSYRWFLRSQLGLSHKSARRIEDQGQGVPGIAVAWIRALVARNHMQATPEGFELGPQLPPPPSLHTEDTVLVDVLCQQASAADRAALRVAAMWGMAVPNDAWDGALQRLGRTSPEPLLAALATARMLRWEDDAWRWASEAARQAALGTPTPAEWIAVAQSLDALPPSPERAIRAGLAYLAAGDAPTARRRLLVHYPMRIQLMERIQDAVEALRPHLEHATVTERATHTRLDLITRLNLVSIQDAEPVARTLAKALGTTTQPGPWRAACDPAVRQRALETTAAVFAHLGLPDACEQLLDGLPETPEVLRTRNLVAQARGDLGVAETFARRGFQAAAHADPSCRAALANDLGVLAGSRDDHAEAERWFRQSILDSDERSSYTQVLNIAIALVAQGRARDAVRPARRGLVLAEQAGRLVPYAYVTYTIVAALAGRSADVRRFGDTALAMVRRNPKTAFPPLAGPAATASSNDPVIQRFLDALRPILPG